MKKQSIAVLGAGAWGTALAIHLALNDHQVCLWAHTSVQANKLVKDKENVQYLSGVTFPDSLKVTSCLNKVIDTVDAVLIVVPSHVFRETLTVIVDEILRKMPHLAWATKGFEPKTATMLHEVASQVLGEKIPKAVLSGPTFASEVAQGLPTAMVSASASLAEAQYWADIFQSSSFRIYTSSDVVGVEAGGAYKNIMAIATGLSDGLQLGANARAALIARGLIEMNRFAQALGAQAETLMGLSGAGDLVLTCTDDLSRNRRFGLMLAKSDGTVDDVMKGIGQVVEGVKAVNAVKKIAADLKLDLPIMEQVYAIINGEIKPRQAVAKLMSRDTGREDS